MKTYKQMFVVLAVGFFIAPQVAFAAWWNPLSWSVWNIFRPAPKVQQVQVATTTPATPTATTTKKTETSVKQDTPKDNKDSVISSLKKQVADLTQKSNQPSQPKVEAPKTSVITLPSGAVVEMDANGNVIRTITAAPQQTYTAPAPTTQNQPTPAANSAPTSRTLEASLQPNAGEIHAKTGEAVARAALFPFTLKASGNADTHISKIKFRTLGPTRFTDMWIESNDGAYVGNKVDASLVFSGGYGYIPVSITLTPGKTSNFTLYVNVPAGAAKSSGVEQLYMEGITSDAGSMSDFPLSGNASLWYDRAPAQISVQSQVCNLAATNLKTSYVLADLLQNGNIDGRIFMNAYILDALDRNYYDSNPPVTMTITTSNHSNDKTINGSGNTGPCGYYYPYEFYATEKGTYTITYSALGLSKSVTITVN